MGDTGMVVYWNDQATELFGWTREEATRAAVGDLIVPEEYRRAHWQGLKHYLATGEAKVFGVRIKIEGLHRNGSRLPVELLIAPVEVGNQRVFSATIRLQTEGSR
jgi:PAS domain S-box-containing protein